MFDEDILMMLFDETGEDFEEWAAQYDYGSMSDKDIYAALPGSIKALCGDIFPNVSWMHDGM